MRVQLTNREFNKLKSVTRNSTRTILRSNKKNFEGEKYPHEVFLTTRQTAKLRNAFAYNMLTDIKLSKTQISKIIQSGGSFGSWLANLGRKVLTNVAIPLARDNLLGLVRNVTSNTINKFERKISGKGAVRAGKRFTLFISDEDMNDIQIIKPLENLGVLLKLQNIK